jgi:hypothetical protein
MASVFSPIKEMTAAEFARVTEVTYLGLVYGTLAALKRMLPRDRGTIVQVGSALAYRIRRSPCRRSISRRSPPRRSIGRRTTAGARCMTATARSRSGCSERSSISRRSVSHAVCTRAVSGPLPLCPANGADERRPLSNRSRSAISSDCPLYRKHWLARVRMAMR